MNNRLNIVSVSPDKPNGKSFPSSKTTRRQEAQAKFDRLWLTDPEQFNPLRNIMEKERLNRTWNLIQELSNPKDKIAVDLGCGAGVFSRKMRDAGAKVDAVDISTNALKALKEHDIKDINPLQDYVPQTILKDDFYDIVVCTEIIAYLTSNSDHRLFFAELSRLVKPNGYVVCSTALDINTQNAAQTFANLAETELLINKWSLGHHLLYIRIKDFFEAPQKFASGRKDPEYRHREIEKRSSFGKVWYRWNSGKILGSAWSILQYITKPIVNLLNNNLTILLKLEKICRFIWSDSGISQAIFIGQRRPMIKPTPDELLAIEPKHKKQVWE